MQIWILLRLQTESSGSQDSETSSEILRFLNNIYDNLLKTLYMIYHKLHIGYHPSTNLIVFKLYLNFIQLKTLQSHVVFMIRDQNVQNFIQFHGYGLKNDSVTWILFFHKLYYITLRTCSSNLTIRQKFFKWHINVENSKLIETSTK
jgi:hypothetical protein